MDPKDFDKALKRYDPDLELKFGLHIVDYNEISAGVEVPYDRRRHRWSVWRKDPNTGFPTHIRTIETDEGGFRTPTDRDLRWLYNHDAYRWTRGRRRPTEAQMQRIEGELLGEDALADRRVKEREDRLEYYRKELARATYRAAYKDSRGNF